MWLLLTRDLELIAKDKTFDTVPREKAERLSIQIRGKCFLAILNFISDIPQHLSFWSQKMQERTALLEDFFDFSGKICNTFEHLKKINGRDLNLFLENSFCDDGRCESIESYYDSEEVVHLEIPLLHDRSSDTDGPIPLIMEIRDIFLNEIMMEIQSYFPMSDLNLFKVFQPSNIPSEVSESLTYGTREILQLCRLFDLIDCEEVVNDWGKLLFRVNIFVSCETKKPKHMRFGLIS